MALISKEDAAIIHKIFETNHSFDVKQHTADRMFKRYFC